MITMPQGFERDLAATTSLKSHAQGDVASYADFESVLTSKIMVDPRSIDDTGSLAKTLDGNVNDEANLQSIKNNPFSSIEDGILQATNNRITSRKSKDSEATGSAIGITNDTTIRLKSTERKKSAHPTSSSIRTESSQAIKQSNSRPQKTDTSIIDNGHLMYVSTFQSVKKAYPNITKQPSLLRAAGIAISGEATISNSVPASGVSSHNGLDGRLSVRFATNVLNVATRVAGMVSSSRSVESINHIKNDDGVKASETSVPETDGIRPAVDSGIFTAKNSTASNNWGLVASGIAANLSYMRTKGLRSSVRSAASDNQQDLSPVVPIAANKPSTLPEIVPVEMVSGSGSPLPGAVDGEVVDFEKNAHMEAENVSSELSGKISAKSPSASGNAKQMLAAIGQSATNNNLSKGRESVFISRSDEHGVMPRENADGEYAGEDKAQTKHAIAPESSTSVFGGANLGVAQKNIGGEQKNKREQTAQVVSPVVQDLENARWKPHFQGTADIVHAQNALSDSGATAANGDLTQDKSQRAMALVDDGASSNVVNTSASKNNSEYTFESNKLYISRAELNRVVSDDCFSGYLYSDAYKGKNESAAISSYHNGSQSLCNRISTLETGIGRGPEDWIKVQASKNAEGIHATLSANTKSGSVMLHEKASELQGYLEEKHISIDLDIAHPKLDEQAYGNRQSFSAAQGGTSNGNSDRDKGESYGACPKQEKENSHGVADLMDHEVHPLLQQVGLGPRVSLLA